jgi:WD40 repeat protein
LETKFKSQIVVPEQFMPVLISPDGRSVLTEREDDVVVLWDTSTGKEKATLNHNTQSSTAKAILRAPFGPIMFLVMNPSFSGDGQRIVTANGDKNPKLWNGVSGELVAALNGHTNRVYGAIFSSDSKTLATATIGAELKLWDPQTGAPKATVNAGKANFFGFVGAGYMFSSDGQTLASFLTEDTKLWNANTGELKLVLEKVKAKSVAFSPDGKTLVTAGDKKSTAVFWDTMTGQPRLTIPKTDAPTDSVIFTPDGRVLLTTTDKGVSLWDVVTGELLVGLEKSRYPVKFRDDGRLLVTGGTNKIVFLYEVLK